VLRYENGSNPTLQNREHSSETSPDLRLRRDRHCRWDVLDCGSGFRFGGGSNSNAGLTDTLDRRMDLPPAWSARTKCKLNSSEMRTFLATRGRRWGITPQSTGAIATGNLRYRAHMKPFRGFAEHRDVHASLRGEWHANLDHRRKKRAAEVISAALMFGSGGGIRPRRVTLSRPGGWTGVGRLRASLALLVGVWRRTALAGSRGAREGRGQRSDWADLRLKLSNPCDHDINRWRRLASS
jgi:hypothetical protein